MTEAPTTVIDLARQPLAVADGRRLDALAAAHRRDFVDFVDRLVDQDQLRRSGAWLDWWVSGTASRHFELSPLFRRLMLLLLCRERLAGSDGPVRVRVDDGVLAGLVRQLAPAGRDLVVVDASRSVGGMLRRLRGILSPWRSMLRLALDVVVVRLCARLAGAGPALPDISPLVLLDSFSLPAAPATDRYYPGLSDCLPAALARRTVLVPQFHGYRPGQLPAAVRALARAPGPCLLKERVLTAADLGWAFAHLLRRRRIRTRETMFAGIDVAALVRADLRAPAGFRCAVQGLLNARFAHRLARRQVAVECVVDWFENHPLDRGWNAGFRTAFAAGQAPRTVGYVGYYPSFDAARPSRGEDRAGVLPARLCVMGEAIGGELDEFHGALPWRVGPALRYPALSRPLVAAPEAAGTAGDAVLVVLPYDAGLAGFLLATVAEAARHSPATFLVKPHPANPMAAALAAVTAARDNLRAHHGALQALAGPGGVVVGGPVATSTLEVLAQGARCIALAPPGEHWRHRPPRALPDGAVHTCDDADSLLRALDEVRCADPSRAMDDRAVAGVVRARFFAPVNDRAALALLGLDEESGSPPDH